MLQVTLAIAPDPNATFSSTDNEEKRMCRTIQDTPEDDVNRSFDNAARSCCTYHQKSNFAADCRNVLNVHIIPQYH